MSESEEGDALQVKMLQECISSDQDSSISDEGEIWEDDSYESDMENRPQNDKTQTVVVGICLYLNFLQLFYRVSKRAIHNSYTPSPGIYGIYKSEGPGLYRPK